MPNKNISVRVDLVRYQFTFTTDEHGLVNIVIDTSNFTSSSIGFLVSGNRNVKLRRLRSLHNLRMCERYMNSRDKKM